MHLFTLLDMAAAGFPDRVGFGSRTDGLTYADLATKARKAATWIAGQKVERVVLIDENSPAVPVLLYGSALAGLPYAPLNYRLATDQLRSVLARTAPAVAVVDAPVVDRLGPVDGITFVTREEFLHQVDEAAEAADGPLDPEAAAIWLFTSGTTGEPKAAVLRHRHLASYVIGSVEFMGATDDQAALVSVPPYHVAGTSAVTSSVYAGRRVVYLPAFGPETWVDTVRDERISQAMVVPTMLGRVLDVLESTGERLPHLRNLAYGGGRMPVPVIERALRMLPHVEFVNAYGLTETSSTIAVLGHEDHKLALASEDPAVRARLGSVGRPLPTVEIEIRDPDGTPVPVDTAGEIWVRGEQVAGEYLGRKASTADGWFPTNDGGRLDRDGFLFLEGRLDDIIVRGAENLSPGEIEDTLLAHPSVADAGAVGVPDTEWGEAVAAVVVLNAGASATKEELQDWVRGHLRSSKTPEHVVFADSLPYNDMGKLLRRKLKEQLVTEAGA
ncbi:class I adenylate-forming enzyme family protein [Streptomyces muensis]|uniref:AMP-binding protein n=1 Tax=Streptomyces muensis TaxID=1077944 RepID=A0A9X1TIU8_STRM4|nr:AMP-binding protein [Streptomyces muensis]MCF1592330.1 AMP-binding protein [Streptomyces muensis]